MASDPRAAPKPLRRLVSDARRLGCDVEVSSSSRYVLRHAGAIVASVPLRADAGLIRRARRALDRLEPRQGHP